MTLLRLFFTGLLLSLSFAVSAEKPDELRYTYVNLDFTAGEIEDVYYGEDVDFGAFVVDGSIAVTDFLAIAGSIGAAVTDDICDYYYCDDVETTTVQIGVVPHFSIGNNVDLVFPISALRVDVEGFGEDEDDTGYSVGIGIRALLNPSWELEAGITHVDVFDDDDQTFSGLVRWHISGLYSMSLGLSSNDDVNAATLGARFTF